MKNGRGNRDSIFLKRTWLHSHHGGVVLHGSCNAHLGTGSWTCSVRGHGMNAFVQWDQKGLPIQANLLVGLSERENVFGVSIWFGRTRNILIIILITQVKKKIFF